MTKNKDGSHTRAQSVPVDCLFNHEMKKRKETTYYSELIAGILTMWPLSINADQQKKQPDMTGV